MSTKRIPVIVSVIAIAAAVVATSSFSAASKTRQSMDDYALRHPEGLGNTAAQPAPYYLGSDFAERHPELSGAAQSIDTSDYFLRHPDLVPAIDASDFYLRHPEFWSVVDTSDYFLRHPEYIGK